MMKVLVIVVTYNGLQWVDRCLGSVGEASREDIQADLFVVDNCSTDGTPERIEKDFPKAILVRNGSNAGFGAANNIGLEYALEHGYDFAYLLNQDAWLLPGTLPALLDAAAKAEGYAILSPLQMQADGKNFDPNFLKRDVPSNFSDSLYPVDRVMAAHWLIRLSALRRTGLFAPVFTHYGEDDNLCDRLRAAGWRIGIVPQAKAVHDRSLREEPKDRLIRRNYFVKSLVELCNPGKALAGQWAFVLVYTLVKAFKYRSAEPFRYLGKLFGMRKEILQTREIAKFA